MANPANSAVQNLLPVQALFNLDNTFNTFIGQGQPFFATINPSQSGLDITSSTINSTTIGAITPSTGVFTNIFSTTGQITTSPTSNSDIANKYYVDSIAQGLSPKQAVKCATTANITLSGLQTIDTYTTLSGDRVLVKNQTNSAENGIYLASATAWTRSVDMDVWSEVPGAYTVIINGSTNANTSWVTTAADTGTIGVTAMPWVQFSGSGTYFAGTGLSLASNTFSITNTGVTAGSYGSASQTLTATVNAQGQLTSLTASNIAISASQTTSGTFSSSLLSGSYTGITGVGTLTAGTWNASTITVPYGGTGATSLTGYVKGSGTTALTAATTIPNTDITGLGTMSTQNANSVAITGGSISGLSSFILTGQTGYVYANGSSAVTSSTTIPTSALSGNFVSTFSAGTTGLTPNTNTSGAVTLAGTLAVANGGTGVTSSSGANSVVLRDANGNITTNCLFEGYSTVAASGTTITLTASSAQNYAITGSGGQVIKLPSATTLPNGALFTFNNNQSSGAITVQNNSSTTIATINSGGYVTVVLLDNTLAAGSWDRHDSTPSNVSWSTNTLDYPGSITSATWNGNVIAINRGGTNGTATPTAGAIAYGSGTAYAFTAAGTTGQVLTSNGSGTPTWTSPASSITLSDDTTTNAVRYPLYAAATSGTISTEYVSSTKYQFNPSTGVLTATGFSGSGAALTSIPNSALNNSSVTIGSTAVALGATVTTFAGLTSVTSTTFVGALTGNASTATSATTATNATNIAITDNTSSVSTYYPVISSATTGNVGATTSSTKLSFVPNTGTLTATNFSGLASSATNIAGGANLQIPYNTGSGATSFITAPTIASTYLQYNGSGFTWAAAGGGGLSWQSVQTANFTAVSGNAYPVNTTSGSKTVTLPASPSAGNTIAFVDYAGTWGTNGLVVNPNGSKLNGSGLNSTFGTNREGFILVYIDATQGWLAYAGFNTANPTQSFTLDLLVVAGGAGGGADSTYGGGGWKGGGGGAGGYLEQSSRVVTAGAFTVTVGSGGAGGASAGASGGTGNNSVFSTSTALGGGSGTGSAGTVAQSGSSGGSGGGGSGGQTSSGNGGSATQGNSGGATGYGNAGGGSGYAVAGGGGGAGGAGTGSVGSGGSGTGKASSISGSSVTYAAGGNVAGGVAGNANTGNGGSGGSGNGAVGYAGGSGVVILKYSSNVTATYSGGVTRTTSSVGGFTTDIITTTSTTSETVTFS